MTTNDSLLNKEHIYTNTT